MENGFPNFFNLQFWKTFFFVFQTIFELFFKLFFIFGHAINCQLAGHCVTKDSEELGRDFLRVYLIYTFKSAN